MKRLLSVILVGLLAAVACVTAAPASANGPFQSVTGSGWRGNLVHPTTPLIHFVVRAQDGPMGVSGIYDLSTPNISNAPLFNLSGQVTCLQIVGNQAIVGGVVTSGGEPGQIGTGFAVGFIDTGPATDTQTFTDFLVPTPVDCTAEQFLFTQVLFPVLNGNVVVAGAS